MKAKPLFVTFLLLSISGCTNGATHPPLLTPTSTQTITQPAGTSTSYPTPQIITHSVTLIGHSGPVNHLSWSPDGLLLASASGSLDSEDYSVLLWQSDGTLAKTLTDPTQPVTSLSWSPDGKVLAAGSIDGAIRLWTNEGVLLKVLRGDAGRVFAVAWSPNGEIIASGSIVGFTNPTVQLWDQNGKIFRTLSTSFSGGKFYNLAWSPDGRYLLGGATDFKLWRADGTQVFWLTGCASCTPSWGMAWSPNSRLWAVGNESGNVEIYNITGAKVASVHDQTRINSLAWSPDGNKLAGAKTIWRSDGTTLNVFGTRSEYVNSVTWSPDGRMFASGGSDSLVHLWTSDGRPLGLLQGHKSAIEVVAWSPDGSTLASASDDGTIKLWKLKQ
jgi:WD40 repeat protein